MAQYVCTQYGEAARPERLRLHPSGWMCWSQYVQDGRCCRSRTMHLLLGGGLPRAGPGDRARARRAEVLEAPGSVHLMVTHKSILRALLCVALGLPPTSFRAFDIHNGGICNFRRGPRGPPPAASCPCCCRRCC